MTIFVLEITVMCEKKWKFKDESILDSKHFQLSYPFSLKTFKKGENTKTEKQLENKKKATINQAAMCWRLYTHQVWCLQRFSERAVQKLH